MLRPDGLRHLPRILPLLWHASPRLSCAAAILAVAEGLAPVALVHFTRETVRLLTAGVGLFAAAWPLALAFACAETIRALSRWTRHAASRLLQDAIVDRVQETSSLVPLEFYDTPDFYDHLHRARTEAAYRPAALVESCGSLLAAMVASAGMLALLLRFGWWMPLVLAAAALPALAVLVHFRRREHRWRTTIASRERRGWYLEWLLTAKEAAAELRLFGLGPRFHEESSRLRRSLRDAEISRAARMASAETLAVMAGFAAAGAVVYRLSGPAVPLPDLVLLYQTVLYGLSVVRSLFENGGAIYANSLFLGNLFAFLALRGENPLGRRFDPVVGSQPAHDLGLIRLRGVSFRYPGAPTPALHGLDLEIHPGEITAIVGGNGAGKSTLLKLLCGFYAPSEGSIEAGGTDLRLLSPDGWRCRVTALFQSPVHYNATVLDNIGLGGAPGDIVRAAARDSGADQVIDNLPARYEQLLGNYFETGVELSAGQWQRIALARALCRPAPLLLLDEPTSAMDPWSEQQWLERLREAVRGRTVVMVTHRFSSARTADRIVVIERGRVAEQGTHEELLALDGPYAKAWRFQAEPEFHP